MLAQPQICCVCQTPATAKYSKCRLSLYCRYAVPLTPSEKCQLQDYPVHQRTCSFLHPMLKTLSFSCQISLTMTDIYDRSTNTRPMAFSTIGDGGVNGFIIMPSTSLDRPSVTLFRDDGVRRGVTTADLAMIVYRKTSLVLKSVNNARQKFTRPSVS
jgi:hypothetical protein